MPCATFEDAFTAVQDGSAALGMIPIENSIAGRVADLHSLLPNAGLSIVGEHFQRVEHCLVAVKGATLIGNGPDCLTRVAMVGNDRVFGDGQNDSIVAGHGADWVSGGTGDDGILGDDGLIFASRNGIVDGEPLYGIKEIDPADLNALVKDGSGALMALVNPHSTTFERSEAWRIYQDKGRLPWRQQWTDYDNISDHLKRAVIASEDDIFAQHNGVQWDAIEKAWAKNAQAELQASRRGQARPGCGDAAGRTGPEVERQDEVP